MTGTSAAVVGPDWAARLSNHAEAIATDPGHMRLDDAEYRGGSDRGIGCVAAGTQGLDGSKTCQWMRSGDHSVAGDNRRAARQVKVAGHGIS